MLAHLTGQHQKVLEKLKKDIAKGGLDCAVSDSVVGECEDKINMLTDFLGRLLVEIIKEKVSGQRRVHKRSSNEAIDYRDVLAVERAFFEVDPHYVIKSIGGRFAKGGLLDLKSVEALIVDFLDVESSSKQPPDLPQAIVRLNALILKLISDLKMMFDSAIRIRHDLAKPIKIVPNPVDVAKLSVIGLHNDDANHIASAKEAEREGVCGRAVFVTVDYSTILPFQTDILNKIGIWCCDPLYAAYHTRV